MHYIQVSVMILYYDFNYQSTYTNLDKKPNIARLLQLFHILCK